MKILGVIPARGGSKGLPNKNLLLLDGKPMIHYTFTEAKKSKFLNRIILSTNSNEIASFASNYEIEYFLHPDKLSTDNSPTFPVIKYLIEHLKTQGYYPDIIVTMRITTPLRLAEDIDGCIEKLIKTNSSSVISVVKLDGIHPIRIKVISENDILMSYDEEEGDIPKRRQDLSPVYIRNGGVYASKIETIENGGLFGKTPRPYIMPTERSVNINNELDYILAEALIKRNKTSHNKGLPTMAVDEEAGWRSCYKR
jgi:CMP-N-acetylneuraminic acid synthetase